MGVVLAATLAAGCQEAQAPDTSASEGDLGERLHRPVIAAAPGAEPDDAACEDGLRSCGDLCVDFLADPHNCGACGANCGRTDVCVGGACAPTPADPLAPTFGVDPHAGPATFTRCSPGFAHCGGLGCVDLGVDAQNCGSCGSPCSGSCIRGRCAP